MGVRPTRSRRRRRRERRHRNAAIASLLLAGLVFVLSWTLGYRHRAEATATNASVAGALQAPGPANGPAFQEETARIDGHSVAITLNGSTASAVTQAADAGTAHDAVVSALRSMVQRLATGQLRVAAQRREEARLAYQRSEEDARNAIAVSGVADIQQALAQRSTDLQSLQQQERQAQGRSPARASELATIVAARQQDLFDLRSLADRLAAATRARDQALAESTRADEEIARLRAVTKSATIPVTVRSSRSDSYLALRIVFSLAAVIIVAVSVLTLLRAPRRARTRTPRRQPRVPAPPPTEERVIVLPSQARVIDLRALENTEANGAEPTEVEAGPAGRTNSRTRSHARRPASRSQHRRH